MKLNKIVEITKYQNYALLRVNLTTVPHSSAAVTIPMHLRIFWQSNVLFFYK